MHDEDALIEEILADPTNLNARRIYADFLEERGDPRGEFLRVQCALQTTTKQIEGDDASVPALYRRQSQLRAVIDTDWLSLLGYESPAIEGCSARYRFQCPKEWDRLEPTSESQTRRCPNCQRSVYYCESIESAQRRSSNGDCIAVAHSVARRPGDLAIIGMMGDMLRGS